MNIDQTPHGGDSYPVIEGSADLYYVPTHLLMSVDSEMGGGTYQIGGIGSLVPILLL
jgi:hypothetical protein